MKSIKNLFIVSMLVFTACMSNDKKESLLNNEDLKKEINTRLDDWHEAAANADFESYFNLMSSGAVFIGTDATENWQLDAFKTFSKPYFDKGKAWSFTAIERNIYLYEDQNLAWFDELLDTQMKICRGSGVMRFEDGLWKVEHYVLSVAIPNENINEVIMLKKEFDSLLTQKLRIN